MTSPVNLAPDAGVYILNPGTATTVTCIMFFEFGVPVPQSILAQSIQSDIQPWQTWVAQFQGEYYKIHLAGNKDVCLAYASTPEGQVIVPSKEGSLFGLTKVADNFIIYLKDDPELVMGLQNDSSKGGSIFLEPKTEAPNQLWEFKIVL